LYDLGTEGRTDLACCTSEEVKSVCSKGIL